MDYVEQGLQPYTHLMVPMAPLGVAEWSKTIHEYTIDVSIIEEMFPEFREKYWTLDWWYDLHKNRTADSNGKLEKIAYPDGSDSVIRGEYESKRVQIERLEDKLRQYPNLPTWQGYKLPDKLKEREAVLSTLMSAIFKMDDVLQFEDADASEEEGANRPVPTDGPPREGKGEVVENAFYRRGDYWEIWYEGQKLNPIKNVDGIDYIVRLLDTPYKTINVSDLYETIHPRQRDAMVSDIELSQSLQSDEMSQSDMTVEGLDEQSKSQILLKVRELEYDKEYAETELERQEATVELDRYHQGLNLYGKNPLSKKAGKLMNESVRRHANAVRKAMNEAIQKIAVESQELAEYLSLKSNLRRGNDYQYIDQKKWSVSL
ncbi:MAG: hypothetical protein LLG97_03835 [Deltaproteobacteria bacterium]|nr:hypothetical protein [Deltaproteobacteria bacterium]